MEKHEEECMRMVEVSLDLMCVAGFDGRFLLLNRRWEELIGLSRPELIGQPFFSWVHPDDHELAQGALARLERGGILEAFECRFVRPDGGVLVFQWNARPAEGRSLFYAIGRDVTLLAAERARAARYRSDLEHREEQVGLLADMGELLRASRTFEDARRVADVFLRRIFPQWTGALYLTDEERRSAVAVSSFGPALLPPVIASSDCWGLRRMAPHWAHAGEALRCRHGRATLTDQACVPLISNGLAYGVLHLEPPVEALPTRAMADRRFMQTVADQLALALEFVSLRQQIGAKCTPCERLDLSPPVALRVPRRGGS
ncbi:MAG: PAS domain S-box protein [Sandaracinaceae bacterium]